MGYPAENHIGAYLKLAAVDLGIHIEFIDASAAHEARLITRQINWRLRQHRPANLRIFSEHVVTACMRIQPEYLLVTGITAPDHEALATVRKMGIKAINFLTDDPWNPVHYAPWFIKTLPYYSKIFSPRESNIGDLKNLGCSAEYVPFAYSPKYHFYEKPPTANSVYSQCDILFYGGADSDRIPYIRTLQETGHNLHLYGGYWDRIRRTRSIARGLANAQMLRWAVSSAKITFCLVRKANRDGHAMRSYEVPAMGGCLLIEDTEEHRELFGNDLQRVAYFRSHEELKEKVNLLMGDVHLRDRLRWAAHKTITTYPNTYLDRLQNMITNA